MIKINISESSQIPLYRQIAEQVKQLVAVSQLQSGDRLPTVRELANYLHVNTGTVVKAYHDLEQERVVVSRRGGGTVVTARSDDPQVIMMRQARLSNMISSNILEVLSLGYAPEDIEAIFHLHLARWHEERKGGAIISEKRVVRSDRSNTITIVGSHDLALNLLVSHLKNKNPEISIEVAYAGSLGGLIALQEERADLAGIHLLDEETGEYNYPYVKHILPGREMAIVHLAYRIQGLMFASGNPKQIGGLEDLRRPDITIINRQKGSGTRVLFDLKLRHQGIVPSELKGYERELDTHLAVANCIDRGEADAGLGIEASAHAYGIGFIPLFKERYDLVMPIERYRDKLLSPLMQIIASEDFRKAVNRSGGYDTSQTGTTTFCEGNN